ncbi:hypothetical protein DPMN_123631 [Dreissena polymorpha]|uniref:Uncharacterized protein n=1 Tax=Dreissena polymorpha TaxID=45954 RepID=A0A9D4GU44_DREPO|nr:hypothetical protein DPMN_123631 [Dreissena polymorpha]
MTSAYTAIFHSDFQILLDQAEELYSFCLGSRRGYLMFRDFDQTRDGYIEEET